MKKASNNKSTHERFEYYISNPDKNGCINWLGQLDKNGYGRIKPSGGKRIRAHRYSYQFFIGPIPEGLCVCHKCDNPSCVNPEHLWLGTNKENSLDRAKKGRGAKNNLAGYPMKMLPNSKLTKEDIPKIRKLIKSGKKCTDIARRYGVTSGTIYCIRDKITWYHV